MTERIERPPQKELDPRIGIVVTGMGAITPLGLNVEATWKGLIDGKSGIVSHVFEKYPQINAKVAGLVQGFDARKTLGEILPPKEVANYLHRSAHFSLAAALEALNQAGLLTTRPQDENSNGRKWQINPQIIDPTEIATIIGTGAGGIEVIAEVQSKLDNGQSASPRHILHVLPERIVTLVTKAFGIKGPEYTIIAACATGNITITEGIKEIMCGDAKMAIVGGTEAIAEPIGLTMFDALGALDRETDPTKTPRPLDKSAGGFVMGEGSAVLVIEREDVARERGARILAKITGYGNTSDAHHDTAPSGEGAIRAMRTALGRLGQKDGNRRIYINPHATATPTGGPIEMGAIRVVFANNEKNIVGISGTKGATGHMLGAIGAVEAVICIKALQDQVMPPTLRLENPIDKAVGLNLVPKETQRADFDNALSNGFGFGGINSTVIFSRKF